MIPRLLRSPLTGQVYVVTRYTVKDGVLIAQRKYEVTADFERAVKDMEASEALTERTFWKSVQVVFISMLNIQTTRR